MLRATIKNNFFLVFFFYSGNGWVGWKKTSFPKKYVDVTFEFDEIRNFTAVHLFTNNFFSKEVQVSITFIKSNYLTFIIYFKHDIFPDLILIRLVIYIFK